jgi:hypothetical protein
VTHPLEAYFCESKNGHIADDAAEEDITGLVNDQELVRDVCTYFHEQNNVDTVCYAVGKVYDVQGESYGCVSLLSEDVSAIIGESLQETHEKINHILISTYMEFRKLCRGQFEAYGAWDDYLDMVMSHTFLSLHENGVRARLIHNDRISQAKLPTVVFVIYQRYDALYGNE